MTFKSRFMTNGKKINLNGKSIGIKPRLLELRYEGLRHYRTKHSFEREEALERFY